MNTSLHAKIIQQTRPATHKNTVIFAVDTAYVPFAFFVASQILEKEKLINFDICICLPDLSAVPTSFLEKNIRICEIAVEGIDSLPIHNLSIAAYHRFFLPKLFELDYEYLLYLDADTYLAKPFIGELFRKDLSKVTLAAAPDIAYIALSTNPRLTKKIKDELAHYLHRYQEKEHIYRNSGVLLINSSAFIKKQYLARILETAFKYTDQLKQHDQTALNMALGNELQFLPLTINWQSNRYLNRLLTAVSPSLIHFIRDQKPWIGVNHLMAKSYYHEYATFLNKFFPTINPLPPTSGYLHRKAHPKYNHSLHEWISREFPRIKQPIADWFYQRNLFQPRLKKALDLINSLRNQSIIK